MEEDAALFPGLSGPEFQRLLVCEEGDVFLIVHAQLALALLAQSGCGFGVAADVFHLAVGEASELADELVSGKADGVALGFGSVEAQ